MESQSILKPKLKPKNVLLNCLPAGRHAAAGADAAVVGEEVAGGCGFDAAVTAADTGGRFNRKDLA